MAGVKWIHLNIDIFSNPKIKYLRGLKDGNYLVLIWIMLLAAAGRSNAGGKICVTENIPMDTSMLAEEFKFKKLLIDRALSEMIKLDMIYIRDGFITVIGWEEHQNASGLEKIREQNRIRQARYKDSQKPPLDNVTNNVTANAKVTHGNATDIESDKDIYKDLKEKDKKKSHFVPPTAEEIKAYCTERHNKVDANKLFDFYSANGWVQGKGKPIKDWKACVRTWESNGKSNTQPFQPKTNKQLNYPQREYTADQYADLERKLLNKGL